MRWPGRRSADRGSGPITALMVMAILALVFTIGITALFAAAADERSSAMHAADAAALAGARGVLDDAPAALSPGFTTPAEIPSTARAAASAYRPAGSRRSGWRRPTTPP